MTEPPPGKTGVDAPRRGGARYTTLMMVAFVAAAVGLWRIVVATQHLIAARSLLDDPSMRELEQVSAAFEGMASVVLFIHAAAALSMARSGVRVEPRMMLALAAYSGVVIAAALLRIALFQLYGTFPLAIALGAFTLSILWPISWSSIYFGVAIGGVAAWALAAPEGDALACLFVVLPCVVYAFAGAWLGRGLARRAQAEIRRHG